MNYQGLGIKRIAARVSSCLSLDRLVMNKSAIRIVVYHRILDEYSQTHFPFDRELVDATVDEFDREIGYLKQNYDIVTFDDVIACLDRNTPLPQRPLLITLDDGYQDNYFHAFPVLSRHAVPATLFLAAGYIGANETFWYDRLAFILQNIRGDSFEYGDGRKVLRLSDGPDSRKRAFGTVMKDLRRMKNRERLSILEEINRAYGNVYDELGDDVRVLSLPLSWKQVNEMKEGGIDLGSHTMTHPFLSRVSADDLDNELRLSKAVIEEKTGSAVSVIAYPNGQREDFTQQVKLAAKEAGYSLGLSYIDGINMLPTADRYELKRLHVFPRHDFNLFRMALSWPGLF